MVPAKLYQEKETMTPPTDIEKVKRDISRARAWAKDHFNDGGPSTLFDPPAFDVVFTDVDKMRVYPLFYGKRLDIYVEYRLKWKSRQVGWEGTQPLTGEHWWLKVSDD
jgi:hypothetical protein